MRLLMEQLSHNMDTIRLDITKLVAIEKELKKKFEAKVGILGDKNNRKDANTNALIGATHEFGAPTKNIKQRSFLRMPLNQKLPEKLTEIGQGLIDNMVTNNIKQQYKKLGIIGENIVHDAFDTGGFGQWAPTKYATTRKKLRAMKYKKWHTESLETAAKHTKILVETRQLEKSISSKVETKP